MAESERDEGVTAQDSKSRSKKRRSKQKFSDYNDVTESLVPKEEEIHTTMPYMNYPLDPDLPQLIESKRLKTEMETLPFHPTDSQNVQQSPLLMRNIPAHYISNFSVKNYIPGKSNQLPQPFPYESNQLYTPGLSGLSRYQPELIQERFLPFPISQNLNNNNNGNVNNNRNLQASISAEDMRRLYPISQNNTPHSSQGIPTPFYSFVNQPAINSIPQNNPIENLLQSSNIQIPYYEQIYLDTRNYPTTQPLSPTSASYAIPNFNPPTESTQMTLMPHRQQMQPTVHFPANPFPNMIPQNRFGLLQHPQEVQRKSYKSENRCLLPNPLVITAEVYTHPLPRILGGQVTVKIVGQSGTDLPVEKQRLLSSLSGNLSEQLDDSLSANFSLKIMETSEGQPWRLKFTVRYVLDNYGECEEEIISKPFVVYSNRRKSNSSTVL